MRLPFPQNEAPRSSSVFRSMTPLKQVAAVNPTAAQRKEEEPKTSATGADREGEAKEASAASDGTESAGASPADGVTEKLEELALGRDEA